MKNQQVPQEFINELAELIAENIPVDWVGTGDYNSARIARISVITKITVMSRKYNFNPDILINNI